MRDFASADNLSDKAVFIGDLVLRRDGGSVQVTSYSSPYFYIRMLISEKQTDGLTFQDFSASGSDEALVFKALDALKPYGCQLAQNMKIIVESGARTIAHEGGLRDNIMRHDQISDFMREYVRRAGLEFKDAFLQPNGKSLDTVILIGG